MNWYQFYIKHRCRLPVVCRCGIKDSNGTPVVTFLSGQTNTEGWSETTWQTQKPNKRGQGVLFHQVVTQLKRLK